MKLKQLCALCFLTTMGCVSHVFAATATSIEHTSQIRNVWVDGDTGSIRFSTVDAPPTSDACASNYAYFKLDALAGNTNLISSDWTKGGLVVEAGFPDPMGGNDAYKITSTGVTTYFAIPAEVAGTEMSVYAKSSTNGFPMLAQLSSWDFDPLNTPAPEEDTLTDSWQKYSRTNMSIVPGDTLFWGVVDNNKDENNNYIPVPEGTIIYVYLPQPAIKNRSTTADLAKLIDAKRRGLDVTVSYTPRTNPQSCNSPPYNTDDLLAEVLSITVDEDMTPVSVTPQPLAGGLNGPHRMLTGVEPAWFWVDGNDGFVRLYSKSALPADACNGFKFDGKTERGKKFFTVMSTAKMMQLPLTIWYAVNTNGCSGSGDSLLMNVGHVGLMY
jgi:hypothetical protein